MNHAPPVEDRAHRAPGPRGIPLLGNIRDLDLADMPGELLRLRRQYGDVVGLRFGPRTTLLVSSPEGIRHIFVDNNKNYIKGRTLYKARPLLGEGLLTSEGDFWRRQRRLIQPLFHRARLEGFAIEMAAQVQAMQDRWDARLDGPLADAPLDLAREMARLTLEIVTRTLFSTGIRPEEADRISALLPGIMAETNRRIRSFTTLRERLPLPSNRRFQRAIGELDAIVYRIIADRRAHGGPPDDLLGMLLSAGAQGAPDLDDHQVRDEVMTIFMAGHETTAALLSWAFMLLSRHPAERARLREEIRAGIPGGAASPDDLEKVPGVENVLNETLRLYPPAWSIARQALGPDAVGGYPVPPGAGILISPYVMHRHPDYWENPEGFDPGRFSPERSQGRPHYVFIPFGGGPRLCIGNNFALLEAGLALAAVLARFELDLVPGCPTSAQVDFTMRPARGIWMRLRRL